MNVLQILLCFRNGFRLFYAFTSSCLYTHNPGLARDGVRSHVDVDGFLDPSLSKSMPQFRTWMLSSTNRCGLTVLLPKQSQYCFGFSSPHLEVLSVLQIVIQYILCPYSWVSQDYSGVLLLAFVYWVILFPFLTA